MLRGIDYEIIWRYWRNYATGDVAVSLILTTVQEAPIFRVDIYYPHSFSPPLSSLHLS